MIFWKRVWKGRPWSRGESRVPNFCPWATPTLVFLRGFICEPTPPPPGRERSVMFRNPVSRNLYAWLRVWSFEIGSGKGGPDPAENPASRNPVIAVPNIALFPNPVFFGESHFPGSSQIPYPVNVSRIPHCIMVKSRIPGWLFQTRAELLKAWLALTIG